MISHISRALSPPPPPAMVPAAPFCLFPTYARLKIGPEGLLLSPFLPSFAKPHCSLLLSSSLLPLLLLLRFSLLPTLPFSCSALLLRSLPPTLFSLLLPLLFTSKLLLLSLTPVLFFPLRPTPTLLPLIPCFPSPPPSCPCVFLLPTFSSSRLLLLLLLLVLRLPLLPLLLRLLLLLLHRALLL